MGVILERHKAATLCKLGDGTLTAPYYPGFQQRPDEFYASTSSYIAFGNYPSTTPDKLVSIIRHTGSNSPAYISILTGPCGYQTTVSVSAGFPATPISGSPFTANTISSTPYANIFPRWTGETAWDLKTFPATDAFTPQGLSSPGVFSYAYPGIGDAARFGMSFVTGNLANDPSLGGVSNYRQFGRYRILAKASEVCCWNEGATLVLKFDIWKIPFTATYRTGAVGYHDFTLGTAVFDSTITYPVTVDASWASATYVDLGFFIITPVSGYFTFVNDVYISSVTAP
jgi:hypothetical protein